ncbi:MAG: hypothetical protein HGB18_03350 [Candidatus Moranbacteria bacterium]|nr:hypothetical protein [Candidatus Moranbacteria bacterium]
MLLILKSKRETGPKMTGFLDALGEKLSEDGTPYSVSSFEDLEVFIEKGSVEIRVEEKPVDEWTTIYPRKVGKYRGLAHMLCRLSERKGVRFLDGFHNRTKDASDMAKIIQIFNLALSGAPVPKTYHSAGYSGQQRENAIAFLGFPIVVKETNSSQGSGVFLAKTGEELSKIICDRLENNGGREIFLQEFIPNTFEYRLLVMGNHVSVAEKKTRSGKEEFRNNVHLGADEEFIDPSKVREEVRMAAVLGAEITDIEIAGVDIVDHPERGPFIFEVNSCPAFTTDETVSPEISELAKYLVSCEKR